MVLGEVEDQANLEVEDRVELQCLEQEVEDQCHVEVVVVQVEDVVVLDLGVGLEEQEEDLVGHFDYLNYHLIGHQEDQGDQEA